MTANKWNGAGDYDALLPFLSLAFGGMYDELPVGDEEVPAALDYSQFTLEKFSSRER